MARRPRNWKPKFLSSLALSANVGIAAKIAGVSRSNVYYARRTDPEFFRAYRRAFQEAADLVEAEAWRRATDGVEGTVYHNGEPCVTVRRYSDKLMAKLLSAYKPKKYSDRQRVEFDEKLQIAGMDADELRAMLEADLLELIKAIPAHVEIPPELIEFTQQGHHVPAGEYRHRSS